MRRIILTFALGTMSCDHAPSDHDDGNSALATETGTSGNATPCDEIGGTVPATCSEWLVARCAALTASECEGFATLDTPAGELGCALAEPLVPGNACAADPPICVAALHTGEGPQGPLWFSGDDVYRVECDGTALPCPAVIMLGWSACGIEAGAPGTCECT
ncbi:MAG: hypothetical protein IPH07_09870 [Deltaproteobacteria bacterium]|nr:hypothetical protein [Deltaproteobacteria bacterium]